MITKVSLFTTIAVLGFSAVVLAGSNSVSISVSCTVPAIPGVNVPYADETSVKGAVSGSGQELAAQDDTGGQSGALKVRTLYPR